jgi:hypothetical protein
LTERLANETSAMWDTRKVPYQNQIASFNAQLADSSKKPDEIEKLKAARKISQDNLDLIERKSKHAIDDWNMRLRSINKQPMPGGSDDDGTGDGTNDSGANSGGRTTIDKLRDQLDPLNATKWLTPPNTSNYGQGPK